MRRSILLAAVLGIAVSTVARAENAAVPKADAAVPPVKAAKPAAQAATKLVRLNDAELDKITAGDATQVHTGHGVTIILNPGNGIVFNKNHHGLVCINLCF